MRKNKRIAGVTMMEILVVMALLALLLLLSFVGWRVQLAKARDAERKNELEEMAIAVSGYYNDNGCYPDESLVYCGSTELSSYIDQVLCDPVNNETYKYAYESESCEEFNIYTKLENEADLAIGAVGCQDGCGPGEGGAESQSYNYYISEGDDIVEGSEEGVDPICGTVHKWCPAGTNECGVCCPGDRYICNGKGTRCITSSQCGAQ